MAPSSTPAVSSQERERRSEDSSVAPPPSSMDGSMSTCSSGSGDGVELDRLLQQNRRWAEERLSADPSYFERLCNIQTPEFLWIGCSDSRVPANVIVGLEPGEIFVQRNVGNQASHTDLNVMACLEYSVKVLKVKSIICCGHYGCGAVKAALQMPSKSQGAVNCWISDIRECRNQHQAELKALDPTAAVDRLCELNVIRQTFHVCTSPVVQSAWDQGQELSVYGLIYSLKDGLMQRLVGPLTKDNAGTDLEDFHDVAALTAPAMLEGNLSLPKCEHPGGCECDETGPRSPDRVTAELASKVALHSQWSSCCRS